MNAIQKQLLGKITSIKLIGQNEKNGEASIIDETLKLTQNEDYHITSYELIIESTSIETAESGEKQYQSKDGTINIPVDFNQPITSITFEFKMDLAEPITLPIACVVADKEAYDAKDVSIQRKKKLEALCLNVRTGFDTAHLYWKQALTDGEKPLIELYAVNRNTTTGEQDDYFMKLVSVMEGNCYASATNLPHGEYCFVFKVIKKDETMFLETRLNFKITDQFDAINKKLDALGGVVRASGRHVVCN